MWSLIRSPENHSYTVKTKVGRAHEFVSASTPIALLVCCGRQNSGLYPPLFLHYSHSANHACHCKKGIVIMTDTLLFHADSGERTRVVTMVEERHMRYFPSFLANFPSILIISSWQLIVPMHQIGSLICNPHNKLVVKMTIFFYYKLRTTLPVTNKPACTQYLIVQYGNGR